jgi:arsenate reductase (thioredoxin)
VHTIAMRLVLISLALALGIQAEAQSPRLTGARAPARVVFVCEHGSVKSLVASLCFNRRAQERGLPYRAVARGVTPSTVPTPVREGLRGDGFEVSDFVPQLFQASDADHAALVVSFDQEITKMVDGRTRYLKWDDLPGVLADYPRGRNAIVRQIDALVDQLTHSGLP